MPFLINNKGRKYYLKYNTSEYATKVTSLKGEKNYIKLKKNIRKSLLFKVSYPGGNLFQWRRSYDWCIGEKYP